MILDSPMIFPPLPIQPVLPAVGKIIGESNLCAIIPRPGEKCGLEQFPLKRKLRKARAALERPEANSRAFPLRR
ncbi:MAG: hypothetical protein H7840_06050, partial [Alphaproteobacteria bacterium]